MKKYFLMASSLLLSVLALASCDDSSNALRAHENIVFTYENEENLENHGTTQMENAVDYSSDYESLVVNPVSGLSTRNDFAFGVDASMVHDIEEAGGVYYDKDGYETDIFTLLKEGGANYFRVRLWNNPTTATESGRIGFTYGGGTNNLENDIELAKRAQEVGMNILVDFHYSDFWADPDFQVAPKAWSNLDYDELLEAVETFTADSIRAFNEEGVKVNAVQIGNEINNGLIDGFGDINWNDPDESFERVSEILTAGIRGARSVDDSIYTIVHLANGCSWDEFEAYFTLLENNKVPYDIIGASYYPYYHGSIELLANNLNACAARFNKPVMVMEVSYGYTVDSNNPNVGNTYNSSFEEEGGFLTSIQGQMTCLRDVVETVVNVPNSMGLGVFYWEPCWIPVESSFNNLGVATTTGGWATEYGLCYKNYEDNQSRLDAIKNNPDNNLYKSTWANQGFFSYSGQALPSLFTYNYLKDGLNPTSEIPLKYRDSGVTYTYNRADSNESLPATVKVETNLDAIRNYSVTWNTANVDLTSDGTYTVQGYINWQGNTPTDGRSTINLTITVIQNYVVDGSFERQSETSTSDNLGGDWTIYSTSPNNEKVVKLNRKPVDVRTGTTDVNFYYAADNFSFNFGQEIQINEPGTYTLTTYVMGIDMSQYECDKFVLYASGDDVDVEVSALGQMTGWASGYRPISLSFEIASATTVTIGMSATNFQAEVWGHVDDFELVKSN